jgi:hypothetical protein
VEEAAEAVEAVVTVVAAEAVVVLAAALPGSRIVPPGGAQSGRPVAYLNS